MLCKMYRFLYLCLNENNNLRIKYKIAITSVNGLYIKDLFKYTKKIEDKITV